MKKLPSIKQLQYLLALHHHQHFGRAAEASFISQSTLSAAITHLEDCLGGQLLERDHKTFIFTPLGEEVVQQSRLILERLDELKAYVTHQGKPMTGSLRLGCIPTIAPFVLSDIVEASKKQYPHLELLLREDTTAQLLHALAEGEIDLLLLALPYPTEGFQTKRLAVDLFDIVLHQDWATQGVNEDMDTWPDHSIFLLEREHCLTNHALQACALKNNQKIHPFFATSLHTLTQMVNSKLGITFLPQMAIRHGILKGTELISRPLASKKAYREIGVAWRSTSMKQNDYQLFIELINVVLAAKGKE